MSVWVGCSTFTIERQRDRARSSTWILRAGEAAFTNRRRPIVTIVEDNSPGEHDMECAACDILRYRLLGFEGPHANCQDNLDCELKALGLEFNVAPQPWNLFTNVVVSNWRVANVSLARTPTLRCSS